nr:hypothetical protein [Tanacetum cinerariifolium]
MFRLPMERLVMQLDFVVVNLVRKLLLSGSYEERKVVANMMFHLVQSDGVGMDGVDGVVGKGFMLEMEVVKVDFGYYLEVVVDIKVVGC